MAVVLHPDTRLTGEGGGLVFPDSLGQGMMTTVWALGAGDRYPTSRESSTARPEGCVCVCVCVRACVRACVVCVWVSGY